MNYPKLKNNQRVPLASIPMVSYEVFMETLLSDLIMNDDNHCVSYFGVPWKAKVRLFCCIASDKENCIYVISALVEPKAKIPSITKYKLAFERFEREIHENFGIDFIDHPWLKPVRYAFDRNNKSQIIANYPFYSIDSEELHEVGVGPIHAGIIEPGHFRFICNGEQILHLEIQLGYQHRGIESLFLKKKKLGELATLAENIAGDTVVGHSVAFANLWESLCRHESSVELKFARTFALGHERIAVHTGDLSAICTDIAYQLGSSVYGRLRTPVINYFQKWCGNRLAKGLIRPGKTNFPLTKELAKEWFNTFEDYDPDFQEMSELLFDLPSALARLERTGVVSEETAKQIGMVGMAARASGLMRDIRSSHPHDFYQYIENDPVMHSTGDVFARVFIRKEEILESMDYMIDMLNQMPHHEAKQLYLGSPEPNSFAISLVEGWRGEICHTAITDSKGDLLHYKIKDPSFHNWLALALAVRNNDISDFPICNKSFNLSYCGHDL
jgi:Ni,Fe-hydrogenase III large subunit